VAANNDAAIEWDASQGNDIRLNKIRPARDALVKEAIGSGDVTGWLATVKEVGQWDTGSAASLTLVPEGCDCTVETWNNGISDAGDNTQIATKSAMFGVVSNLQAGDQVVFDGHILRERSITDAGSITDPAWVTRFTRIEPIHSN